MCAFIWLRPALTANYGNRKYTGPRTAEGIARSAQNARKQGFPSIALQAIASEQAEFGNYQSELPMANPAVRDVTPNLREFSDPMQYQEAARLLAAEAAIQRPDWRAAPREE